MFVYRAVMFPNEKKHAITSTTNSTEEGDRYRRADDHDERVDLDQGPNIKSSVSLGKQQAIRK
jgi:hypothetical protein